jgi:hypothetical protein
MVANYGLDGAIFITFYRSRLSPNGRRSSAASASATRTESSLAMPPSGPAWWKCPWISATSQSNARPASTRRRHCSDTWGGASSLSRAAMVWTEGASSALRPGEDSSGHIAH